MAILPEKFTDMEEIKRDLYLNRLIEAKEDGLIKVITGLRRVGKSYLLNHIFYNYLLSIGVKKENIIRFAFDKDEDIDLLDNYYKDEPTKIKRDKLYVVNSKKFRAYIKDNIKKEEIYYLLLDEIQLLDNFSGTLSSYLDNEKIDCYVSGSNSYMLSNDVITTFRGRSTNIYVLPLTFKEVFPLIKKEKREALNDYLLFGGLPLVYSKLTYESKSNYLKDLYTTTYIKDIVERRNIIRSDVMEEILLMLSSTVSSLTNPKKISDTYLSKGEKEISINTITKYLSFLEESYLINKVNRFDISGKEYLISTVKYFFTDLGLRNAKLNFKNNDIDRMLENCVYNELLYRGYNINVGVIEVRENNIRKQLEVDFIATKINKKYYIQVTLSLENEIKRDLEKKSLLKIKDSFKKVIIVYEYINPYYDENGFLIISIFDFLLNDNSLDIY